jgi:hypothetical protein
MRITLLIGLAAALAPAQSERKDTPTIATSTTARVVGIERATITLPGYRVKDYAACVKITVDWPNAEYKKAVMEDLEKQCKQLDEMHKKSGILPGYYPPKKEMGYIVTVETATAMYVVSTLGGRCTEVLENGQCGGEQVSNVVVGQSYPFEPSCPDETSACLLDPPVKKGAVPVVRLIGHLESVVEKKRGEIKGAEAVIEKRIIKLNGDLYIVEFADGWAKVSKKNSNQSPTVDEVILVLREYAAGNREPKQ